MVDRDGVVLPAFFLEPQPSALALQARLTGIRVAVPIAARAARLSGLPDGVSVEPGRIEMRFSSAKDAVGRLFALAQALTHDYEQFEALVEEGDAGRGGGAGRA